MNEYLVERLERIGKAPRLVWLLSRVERENEAFTITRDGTAIAVVISIEEYDKLCENV